MFHIVLYQPEIPPNTGNIMRLCAATGATLHLIGPLGFRLDATTVRRAGMDYCHFATVVRHDDWSAYLLAHPDLHRLFALSTHGRQFYHQITFQPGDHLLFGSEGSGLPPAIHQHVAGHILRLPMQSQARSLNLANTVAIVLYEALRQNNFPHLQ